MPVRPCLGCSRLTSSTYCAECQLTKSVAPNGRRIITRAERARRARAKWDHVNAYGWVCPGYERPAHESRDLTADHVQAVADGGSEAGRLEVLCRSCNSRKNGRNRPADPRA